MLTEQEKIALEMMKKEQEMKKAQEQIDTALKQGNEAEKKAALHLESIDNTLGKNLKST